MKRAVHALHGLTLDPLVLGSSPGGSAFAPRVVENWKIYCMSPIELRAMVERIRSEFLEMPGLRLTLPQAARLWGLDIMACEQVVDVLIQSAFLRRTGSGAVTRADG
jgi:hypothetical protein